METWEIDQVPPQPGRVAIVTGANSGLGYETALELARKEINVVLACRTQAKGEEARQRILANCPNARLTPLLLDLASLKQVKAFAQEVQRQFDRVDLLINNAGIMMSPYQVTEDGFENQFAPNYIGHFALTGLLLPAITRSPGARVVTLSSLSYKWAEIDFGDLHAQKEYSRRKAYGQSKRACLIFAFELQRRLSAVGYDTRSVAAHPGLSKTNLDQYFPKLIRPLGSLFLQSAKKGALPILYAALADDLQGGEFIGPDGFQELRGNPTRVSADDYSRRQDIGQRLWQVSEAMTSVHYLSDSEPTPK